MVNEDKGFLPADRVWMGWQTDMQHRALQVIATTRCEWLSRNAADGPAADRARSAHPLFGLALNASTEP